jgi:hypothetical protein
VARTSGARPVASPLANAFIRSCREDDAAYFVNCLWRIHMPLAWFSDPKGNC